MSSHLTQVFGRAALRPALRIAAQLEQAWELHLEQLTSTLHG